MSADSIVGDGLAPSPYEQMRAERDEARALLRESTEWLECAILDGFDQVEALRAKCLIALKDSP